MKLKLRIIPLALAAFGLVAHTSHAAFTPYWELGQRTGNGWPLDGVGGGPDVDFVQEAGVNTPPGNPNSPAAAQQADDDYYFAGTYTTLATDAYGTYTPVGTVANDEIAMERAFAGTDNNLRVHFNLPSVGMDATSLAQVLVKPFNLQGDQPNPRYGLEVYFNGVLIKPEQIITSADFQTLVASDTVTLGSVNALFGPGGDNIVELRGINYNADGGGNWMGMDYHTLEVDAEGGTPIPTLSEWGLIIFSLLLLTVGVVRIRNQPAMMMAGAGGVNMALSGGRKPLFVPQVFAKCFTVTLLLAAVGLGTAVWFLGSVPIRDIVGTLISATIVAYLAHTLLPGQDAKE